MSERPAELGGPTAALPEPSPPLGGWGRLYALVIAVLIVDLALLWWLTERYR